MVHGGDIYRNQVKIDFSVNINPLGMPEAVQQELLRTVGDCVRYPDMISEQLTGALADYLSDMLSANARSDSDDKRHAKQISASDGEIQAEQICCGNGASELFAAIVHACLAEKRKQSDARPVRTLIPVPSFFGYEKAAQMADGEIIFYQMKETDGFALTREVIEAINEDIDLLFLANPNNPVGNRIEPEVLREVADKCRTCGVTLVIDECFLPFCADEAHHSFLPYLKKYPNVIVVRAFTKIFAMPGVRLGYLVCADEERMEQIRRQLPEWNVSLMAQRAGVAALGERGYLKETVNVVERERRFLTGALRDCGMKVFPSETNFLMLYTKRKLYEELLEQEILIRDCSNYRGLGEGYYRVAVKNHAENLALLDAINHAGQIAYPVAETQKKQIEYVLPGDIEKRSFEIIGRELKEQNLVIPDWQERVTKRVIHTSADFSYARTMCYSKDAVQVAKQLLRDGADVVTDTNMALAGINKRILAKYGGTAHCFMADEQIAKLAKEHGTTRATASMEYAATIKKPVIFAVGNAPTALIALHEMYQKKTFRPAFIIGVPVGFVNVEAAKELILETDVPYIVNRGRKGGSNVAAAIVNALLYELDAEM